MEADFDMFGSEGQGTHIGSGHLLALDAQPFDCAQNGCTTQFWPGGVSYIVSSISYLLVVNGSPNWPIMIFFKSRFMISNTTIWIPNWNMRLMFKKYMDLNSLHAMERKREAVTEERLFIGKRISSFALPG
jgi:hypothetical protein